MDQRRSLPSRKVPISLHTSFPDNSLPPDLRSALQTALLTPYSSSPTSPPLSSIPKIQLALSSALEDTGWSKKVEAYIVELVRNRDIRSQTIVESEAQFSEIMAQVIKESRSRNIGNLSKSQGENSEIQIAERVVQAGVTALRHELDRISEVVEVDD